MKKINILFISARRMGDATIHALFIKKLVQHYPNIHPIVWTTQDNRGIFEGICGRNQISIYIGAFPICTSFNSFIKYFFKYGLKSIYNIRRLKIDLAVDFIGDIREIVFLRLISKNVSSPKWVDHWMGKLILFGLSLGNVPVSRENIYEAYRYFLEQLGFTLGEFTCPVEKSIETVGLQIFSSQNFKSWPIENWLSLIKFLHSRNVKIFVFCHPSESIKINSLLSPLIGGRDIISEVDITSLMCKLKMVDFLIGVDSFLSHLAFSQGVRSFVINAGNGANYWTPPFQTSIASNGDCNFYPCANSPKCLGTPFESSCINSIGSMEVVNYIDSRLNV